MIYIFIIFFIYKNVRFCNVYLDFFLNFVRNKVLFLEQNKVL